MIRALSYPCSKVARCAWTKTPALYSRDASNFIDTEPKLLVKRFVVSELSPPLTRFTNFVLKLRRSGFVVSVKLDVAGKYDNSV